jgi:hypothetical protein
VTENVAVCPTRAVSLLGWLTISAATRGGADGPELQAHDEHISTSNAKIAGRRLAEIERWIDGCWVSMRSESLMLARVRSGA